jgi:8-oxo-dGTP pyrophosphatase MutT (NUDIX family)
MQDMNDKIKNIMRIHQIIKEIKEFPDVLPSEEIKNKVHFISVTGIIRNSQGKYLICKRSPKESAFPNKWCVPGGKIELQDFVNSPKDTKDHWLSVFEKILEKEISEETGLKIKNLGYVSSLAFLRKNGYSSIIVSLHCEHAGGSVSLQKEELVEHAWVTLEEAKNYDLIENIYEQIKIVENKHNN